MTDDEAEGLDVLRDFGIAFLVIWVYCSIDCWTYPFWQWVQGN